MMQQRQPIRVIAVGDISLNGHYAKEFYRRGLAFPCEKIIPEWNNADLLIGNLESPITKAPRAAPSKCTLRAPEVAADFLKEAGFSLVTLANNHMMDYSDEGLHETLMHLEAVQVPYLGAGIDEAHAGEALIVERKQQRIGLLSYCDVVQKGHLYAAGVQPGVNRWDLNQCISAIERLESQVDWVIVNLHWGMEMALIPSPEQRAIANQLVDAGANLILGHHPHVVQPMEMIGMTPVFYSLGNFLFSDMYWRGINANGQHFVSRLRIHPLSRLTGWADVELVPGQGATARFHPARLKRDLSIASDNRRCRLADCEQSAKRLLVNDYAKEYGTEKTLAEQRTSWRWAWKPLLRRVEMKLFCNGLLPNTVEGT